MSNTKYSIGVDYGSLSGRAVLVNISTGEEIATAVHEYKHLVMSEYLPDNITKLEMDWALQHPQDYLDVLEKTIPEILRKTNVSPDDVVGVGVDFTACTVLPILNDGTPLCFLDEYKDKPHAYVKLWKHHAAQFEADELNRIATEHGEDFLNLYGGKISSEWLVPKAWQTLNEAPEIYNKMDKFIEAGDWIVWQLTGNEARNSCMAGYKAMWNKKRGYPSKEFFKALDPRLENLVAEKLSKDIFPIGKKAGEINEISSKLTGLKIGTAVSVANIDAHVAVPTVGISEPRKMLMIMGTSTCHIMLGDNECIVPGMCGVVEDGVIEGYYGYEAGQSCVGDHFDWFVKNCVPADYLNSANELGEGIHKYLRDKAKVLKVGESGLLALDWWNGNRSVLVDANLTGMIIGLTLQTKPEEIYRALIEATAFGTKIIIDTFESNGVPINELYAAGGIAEKDEFMMQIYSDVTNMEIRIAGSAQAPAYGSAMFGAVVAGKENGGFDTIKEVAEKLCKIKDIVYKPIPENVEMYKKLYAEYKILSDYFGKGANDVMKRLKTISASASNTQDRCIIFDMDGVLVNSEPVIEMAAVKFFSEIGINVISDDFKPFIGSGEDRYIGGVCEKYDIAYNPKMKDRVYEIYQQIVGEFLKVYDGTIPLLKKLIKNGYKVALASSADRIKIDANLAVAGIEKKLFEVIISGEDVVNKKPSPDIYIKVADVLGISCEKCIVIEDAVNGIQAAKSAGMKCIGITTSFSQTAIINAGADDICNDISEVFDVICAY